MALEQILLYSDSDCTQKNRSELFFLKKKQLHFRLDYKRLFVMNISKTKVSRDVERCVGVSAKEQFN